MVQNISYGIGQYRYIKEFEYINHLKTVNENDKQYIDYKPDSSTTYRDIAIKLPDNVQYGDTYYMTLTIPQDLWYDITLNLKLCSENSSKLFDINFNKFQQIKQLIIPKTSTEKELYSDVVLFEYTLNNNNYVDVDIPIEFPSSGSTEPKRLYYKNENDNLIYRYCNSSTSNWNNLLPVQYSRYNLLQAWQLQNVSENLSELSTITFSFTFSPKYNLTEGYKYLWLEIVHNDNYIQWEEQSQTYNGKFIPLDLVQADFYKVNNILPITNVGIASIKSGINRLNSILVTGPKGLILNINGEEVKIGMQDQYKLDNFDISFLGIAVTDELKEDNNFSFLIDYQYKIEN